MLQLLKKRLKNQKGLSLVELLAVIVILGIVSAIAVPSIGGIIENSRYNAVKSDAINILNAANLYFADDFTKTDVTVSDLKAANYLESTGGFEIKASESTITKGAGSTSTSLTTDGGIIFSGSKTVTFTGATISGINNDSTKGSEIPDAGHTIDE
ncbi:type II secretion system protein [Solibacillus sp. FSL K6-4121]|uniref:type II secretion system protein n=1 Tax=Solibacillus sp. FSL K6-4121 TaxID=2921505 RepID=UPI0030F7D2D5